MATELLYLLSVHGILFRLLRVLGMPNNPAVQIRFQHGTLRLILRALLNLWVHLLA